MSHSTPYHRVKTFTLLILLCFSCGILFSDVTTIKQVKSFNDQLKTRIIFESDQPLVYSAYTTEDSTNTIVIDFPDTALSGVEKVLNILTPEVKSLRFEDIPLGADAMITRAKIELTGDLAYHISQHRNFFYMDVLTSSLDQSKTPTRVVGNDRVKEENKNTIKPAETPDPVNTVTPQVKVDGEEFKVNDLVKPERKYNDFSLPYMLKEVSYDVSGENIVVNLFYSGDPEHSTFELQSPDRLIVDFHKTVCKLKPKQVNVDTLYLKRIRSAQFQSSPMNITRVVFDVNKPYNYKIIKEDGYVKVAFGTSDFIASLENPAPVKEDVPIVGTADAPALVTAEEPQMDAEPIDTVDITGEATGQPVNIQDENTAAITNEAAGEADLKLFETANPQDIIDDSVDTTLDPKADDSSDKGNKLFTDSDYQGSLVSTGAKYVGEPISLLFKDADIKDIIQVIGDVTGKNFIVDDKVRGKVTINFKSVPWDQALDIILSLNNLGMEEENDVIIVASLSKLEQKHKKEKQLEEERILSGPTDVITRRISYAKANDVAAIVEKYLTRRGQVIVDTRTNLLLIRELRAKMDIIQDLIDRLDVPTRQVKIEARIIETTRNYEKDLGIQWGWQAIADDETGNATRYIFPHDIAVQGNTIDSGISGVPYAVNLPAGAPTSGFSLTMGNVLDTLRLDASITAMEEDGKGRILSAPSIATQNNIEATILSGSKIPYTSIVDNTASVSFIQAKLELRVTPQITSDDTIIMEVTVEKTEPDYSTQITNVQGALPTILEKKAESTMLVKDGGTAVIGGILQVNDSESEKRVPFFHQIPIIGSLFKSNNWRRADSELLIFITPKILGYN